MQVICSVVHGKLPVDIETGSSSVELLLAKMSRNPALALSKLEVFDAGSLPAVVEVVPCCGGGGLACINNLLK